MSSEQIINVLKLRTTFDGFATLLGFGIPAVITTLLLVIAWRVRANGGYSIMLWLTSILPVATWAASWVSVVGLRDHPANMRSDIWEAYTRGAYTGQRNLLIVLAAVLLVMLFKIVLIAIELNDSGNARLRVISCFMLPFIPVLLGLTLVVAVGAFDYRDVNVQTGAVWLGPFVWTGLILVIPGLVAAYKAKRRQAVRTV